MRIVFSAFVLRLYASEVLVQYGRPRTATTFQFEVLCAATCLAVGPERTNCLFCHYMDLEASRFEPGTVCKVHGVEQARRIVKRHSSAKLFVAESLLRTRPNQTWKKHEAATWWLPVRDELQKSWGLRVDYVQLFESLGLRGGYTAVYDYQPILNLTDDHATQIASFMRYWEILRRCCGAQMSTDYRHRLWAKTATVDSQTDDDNFVFDAPDRRIEDPSYDACEAYNLPEVERLYLQTTVYRKCATVPLVARLSDNDEKLSGDYCRRASQATQRFHLRFNDRRYREGLTKLLHQPQPSPRDKAARHAATIGVAVGQHLQGGEEGPTSSSGMPPSHRGRGRGVPRVPELSGPLASRSF